NRRSVLGCSVQGRSRGMHASLAAAPHTAQRTAAAGLRPPPVGALIEAPRGTVNVPGAGYVPPGRPGNRRNVLTRLNFLACPGIGWLRFRLPKDALRPDGPIKVMHDPRLFPIDWAVAAGGRFHLHGL